MKRGFTLVEIVVAMGIFSIVATLSVTAFTTVSNMKSLGVTMRETQQKTRVALEMVSRLSRQAEVVNVTNSGKTLDLFFQLSTTPKAARFVIDPGTGALNYWESCSSIFVASLECENWGTGVNILEGSTSANTIKLSSSSAFSKIMINGSPELNIVLDGNITNTSQFFSNSLRVNTSVVLEALK